jgi:hypothetical protein
MRGLNTARSPRRANVPVTSSIIGLRSQLHQAQAGPPGRRPSAAAVSFALTNLRG